MRTIYLLPALLLTGVVLGGCGGNNTFNPELTGGQGTTATPTFTLTLSPASRTVVQGDTTTYTATLTSQNGFNSPVTLSVSGLPADTTGTFSPNPVTPTTAGAASTLTVVTTGQPGSLEGTIRSVTRQAPTPEGMSTLTVTATGGGVTVQGTVQLVVQALVLD